MGAASCWHHIYSTLGEILVTPRLGQQRQRSLKKGGMRTRMWEFTSSCSSCFLRTNSIWASRSSSSVPPAESSYPDAHNNSCSTHRGRSGELRRFSNDDSSRFSVYPAAPPGTSNVCPSSVAAPEPSSTEISLANSASSSALHYKTILYKCPPLLVFYSMKWWGPTKRLTVVGECSNVPSVSGEHLALLDVGLLWLLAYLLELSHSGSYSRRNGVWLPIKNTTESLV